MTREELYAQWERLHDRGTRPPAYWAAVAAIVRWDEDRVALEHERSTDA